MKIDLKEMFVTALILGGIIGALLYNIISFLYSNTTINIWWG